MSFQDPGEQLLSSQEMVEVDPTPDPIEDPDHLEVKKSRLN